MSENKASSLVSGMISRLRHRGPDSDGSRVESNFSGVTCLGHTRLIVIDPDGSIQPFVDEKSGTVLVFNGEIYNFQELRRELQERGHAFSTRGDTEVVLHSWIEWREHCVNHFRGMFALAIWDNLSRSLFLARDRLGKKPLYYRILPGSLLFASEIKALLTDPDYSAAPNLQAIGKYMELLYVDGEETAFEEIYRLPPAAYLLWNDGKIVKKHNYWKVDFTPRAEMDAVEAAEELRKQFDEAVNVRLVSDVPLGAFLSGGLDSSLVVAHMARHLVQPVETFTVGFDELVDERPKARLVVQKYGTRHHEIELKTPPLDMILQMAEVFDEPFADSSGIPTFMISEFARRSVTVALTGDGGDELFAGYRRHLHLWWGESVNPKSAGVLWERIVVHLLLRAGWRPGNRKDEDGFPNRAARRINEMRRRKRFPDPWQRVKSVWSAEMAQEDFAKLWQPHLRPVPDYDLFEGREPASSAVQACFHFDLNSYLPGDLLIKADMTSMANSLEVRSPFLDHHLVEFAAKIPFRLKFGSGRTKDLLRQTFSSMLPAPIRNQRKTGFGAPWRLWLKTPEVRRFTNELLSADRSFLSTLFQKTALTHLNEEFNQTGKRAKLIWAMLFFGIVGAKSRVGRQRCRGVIDHARLP